MHPSGSPFPTRMVVAIAAPLLVGVLLSVWVVSMERDSARLRTDATVRGAVANAVSQVRTAVRDQMSAATAGTQGDGTVVPVADVAKSQLSLASATTARDGGAAILDDTLRPPAVVVPIYSPAAPATTTDRRADITGYRLVPLTLETVITPYAPDAGGLVVRGPTTTVAAVRGSVPAGARSYSVDMQLTGMPGWAVEAWLPSPALPGITWFWVLGLLVLFGAISWLLATLVRRDMIASARAQQLERDRALVTGIAPVLQASLDMGEVLPSVAAHLADGLALTGFSLSAPSPRGERQVYAWGVAPDKSVLPAVRAPQHLDTGATFALSLTRGGRVLGTLRVVCGEPLGHDDLVALISATELLGSTLANAEAFARQQDLLEQMRAVDELKTVFLATASHELRTPVTAIVGFSTLLLDRHDPMDSDQNRNLMERVLANGRRLETLIEQLLDFSRLERGLPRQSEAVIDLGRVVGKILTDQPELVGNHELVQHLDEGCAVRGATAAVERILTNLVGNAAKYSPPDTFITVRVWTQGDRVQLVVDDQGPGVPEGDRKKVFSRFYRGHGTINSTKGVGIGLAIVSEYAASMSGIAGVAAAPGGGARFSISFPAVRAPAAPTVPVEGEPDVART